MLSLINKMSSLNWYFWRIRKISILEYPYRINQLIKRRVDKLRVHKPFMHEFRPLKALFSGRDFSDILEYFPQLEEKILNKAEDILNHRFEIFGIQKHFGEKIDWHLDPKTEKSWPMKFWGDIDYRNGKTYGGIKFAWELNRLHHFPQLALAFLISGRAEYKEEIFRQMRSWMLSNPYPQGINWIMGIESGIRIVNVFFTFKFLGEEGIPSPEFSLINEFMFQHARHIFRFPSKYSSSANHSLAEALGLFVSGAYFSGMKKSRKWKIFGKKVLEKEVLRQVYPDGSHFEHSIFYLQFVLDIFLVYYLLCKEMDEELPPFFEKRLKSAFNFISHLLDKEGNYPQIGDEDEGYLLKLWFGRHNNFVSLLNTGAVLFSEPTWIQENAEYDLKTFLLLGKESKKIWDELRKKKKHFSFEANYFRNSGLAVIRDRSELDILFVGNSGPLGMRPLAAHGHSDALSFWISVKGRQMFVDPGTYLYHGGGRWRSYFRSTSAHNTIRVDQRDQATIVADFIFKDFYRIEDVFFKEFRDVVVWCATHNGYLRLTDPVWHKREVFYWKKEKLLEIIDNIICKKEHLLEIFFHFHPECCVVGGEDGCFITSNGAKARLKLDSGWRRKILVKGSFNPFGGWYSSSFNRVQESFTLVAEAKISGNKSYKTEIIF